MVPLQDTSTCDGTNTNTSTCNGTNVNNAHPNNQTERTQQVHTCYSVNYGERRPTHQGNLLVPTSTKAELARYHHQWMGSPPNLALLRTLQNHSKELETFPGLDKRLITRHLPPSKATAKGHRVRVRKGLNSTKSNRQDVINARAEVDDMVPQEQACTVFDNKMFCFVVTRDDDNKTIYSDLTGRFPVESYTGMNYLLVVYVYHLNAPMIRIIKSRKDDDMVEAFRLIYNELKSLGHKPPLHVLDNECSRVVKSFIVSNKTGIQLVEPHNHRVNAAEVAIKAVKYHFLVHLATTDPTCPL